MIAYDKNQIDDIWPYIERQVTRVLDLGSVYTLWQVYTELKNGNFHLWALPDAFCITAILRDPDKYCLIAILQGRNMKDWLPYLSVIEEWARVNDCTEVRVHGRRGWPRVLNYDSAGTDEQGFCIARKKL